MTEHEPKLDIEKTIGDWQAYLKDADLHALLDTALETEVTDDGDIYVIATPEGLQGDFAIVDMRKIKVDTPHLHTGEETEVHLPLSGFAQVNLGQEMLSLRAGESLTILPETPHFVIPDDEYITGVLSLPGYNPDNQLPVDPLEAGDTFNAELYLSLIGE